MIPLSTEQAIQARLTEAHHNLAAAVQAPHDELGATWQRAAIREAQWALAVAQEWGYKPRKETV